MRSRVSVIVPWCNRKNIGHAVARNGPALERSDAELIIVNFGGDGAMLVDLLGDPTPPWLRILAIDTPSFNKCCAQNLGVKASRGEILFFIDEDIVLEDDTLEEVVTTVSEGGCFATIERVEESEPVPRFSLYLDSVTMMVGFRSHNGQSVTIETNTSFLSEGARGGPGLACLTKADFLEIGGMNSMIHGRGWSDIDLIARLQFALNSTRKKLGRATHFSHSTREPWEFDDRVRSQSEPLNYQRCLRNYSAGRFQGSFSTDIERWLDSVI